MSRGYGKELGLRSPAAPRPAPLPASPPTHPERVQSLHNPNSNRPPAVHRHRKPRIRTNNYRDRADPTTANDFGSTAGAGTGGGAAAAAAAAAVVPVLGLNPKAALRGLDDFSSVKPFGVDLTVTKHFAALARRKFQHSHHHHHAPTPTAANSAAPTASGRPFGVPPALQVKESASSGGGGGGGGSGSSEKPNLLRMSSRGTPRSNRPELERKSSLSSAPPAAATTTTANNSDVKTADTAPSSAAPATAVSSGPTSPTKPQAAPPVVDPATIDPTGFGGDPTLSLSEVTDFLRQFGVHDGIALRELCKRIIRKPPSTRTESDIHTLFVWVMSLNCKLFSELHESVVKEVCASIGYVEWPADSVVFRQGDVSDKLFIVIKGSVSVWIGRKQQPRLIKPPPPAAAGAAPSDENAGSAGALSLNTGSAIGGGSSDSGPVSTVTSPTAHSNPSAAPLPPPPPQPAVATASASEPKVEDEFDEVADRLDSTLRSNATANARILAERRASRRASGNKHQPAAVRWVNRASQQHHSRTKSMILESSPSLGTSAASVLGSPPGVGRPINTLKLKQPPGTKLIGIIRAGARNSAFGELGLISNELRSATIQTEEKSAFLVVTKTDFDAVLKRQYTEDITIKKQNIRRFELFKIWNETLITKISLYLERRTFTAHTDIVQQNGQEMFLYFILSGECQLTHTVTVHSSAAAHSAGGGSGAGGEDETKSKSKSKSPKRKSGKADASLAPASPAKTYQLVLTVLSAGQMFGESAALSAAAAEASGNATIGSGAGGGSGAGTSAAYGGGALCGVHSLSRVEAFVIHREHFIQCVKASTLAQLRSRVAMQNEFRLARIRQLTHKLNATNHTVSAVVAAAAATAAIPAAGASHYAMPSVLAGSGGAAREQMRIDLLVAAAQSTHRLPAVRRSADRAIGGTGVWRHTVSASTGGNTNAIYHPSPIAYPSASTTAALHTLTHSLKSRHAQIAPVPMRLTRPHAPLPPTAAAVAFATTEASATAQSGSQSARAILSSPPATVAVLSESDAFGRPFTSNYEATRRNANTAAAGHIAFDSPPPKSASFSAHYSVPIGTDPFPAPPPPDAYFLPASTVAESSPALATTPRRPAPQLVTYGSPIQTTGGSPPPKTPRALAVTPRAAASISSVLGLSPSPPTSAGAGGGAGVSAPAAAVKLDTSVLLSAEEDKFSSLFSPIHSKNLRSNAEAMTNLFRPASGDDRTRRGRAPKDYRVLDRAPRAEPINS